MAITIFSGAETGGLLDATNSGEWTLSGGVPSGGTIDYSTAIKRNGYYSLRCNATNSTNSALRATLIPTAVNNNSYVTFWIRFAAFPVTNSVTICGFSASGTSSVRVNVSPTGTLQLQWGAGSGWTSIGSPSSALSLDTWHRIDLSSVGHSGTSLSTELKLNGSSVASQSGIVIAAGSLLGFRVGFAALDLHSDTWDYYVDDVIIRDDNFHTDDGGVVQLRPNANGNYTAWTGDFTAVDELAADGATSLLTTSSTTDAETSDLTDASDAGVGGTIVAVMPFVTARRGATGGVTISLRMRSNTTDTDFAYGTMGINWAWHQGGVHLVDPDTGIAWTSAGLDALEVGVVATGATGGVRDVTQYGAAVWCTAPVAAAPLVPIISSISPDNGPKAGSTGVTITGSNFTGATSANIGGVDLTSFTVVSDTSITGTTAAISKAGTYLVQVVHANGIGSLVSGFTYTPGNSSGNSGNNAGGSTSLVVTMPATATDEQLIAVITVRGVSNTVTQASWGTAIDIRAGTDTSSHTFKRTSTGGSEPASYTFTIGTSAKASGVITSTPDVDSKAVHQVSSQANASSTSITAPSLTPRRLGSVSIFGANVARGTTVTPPTSYTEPANSDNASTGGSAATRTTTEQAFRLLTTLAATGTVIGTAATGDTNIGVQVMLDSPTTISPPSIGSAESVSTPTLVAGDPPDVGDTVSPSAIASAEAIGSHTLIHGNINIVPTAVASAEAIGAHTLKATNNILPAAIDTAEAFGAPTLIHGNVNISPAGIASGEAIGAHTLNPGAVTIALSAIASAEIFGAHVLKAIANILPAAIDTAEAFGAHTLLHGGVIILPSATDSAEIFGSHILKATANILPSAIDSVEVFGAHTLIHGNVNIVPTSIPSAEAFGAPVLAAGNVNIIPTSISSVEAFGSHTLLHGNVNIIPTGIPSEEAFGTPTLIATASILPAVIDSAETFGAHTLIPGGVLIIVGGIPSAEEFGTTILMQAGGSAFITPASIDSEEVFGNHTLIAGGVLIIPDGIPSPETFGSPTVLAGGVSVSPTAIDTEEALGLPVIIPGTVNIIVNGVPSDEQLGAPTLIPTNTIIVGGIISEELFGLPELIYNPVQAVEPPNITSEELFGLPLLIPGNTFISPVGIVSEEVFGTPNLQGARSGWSWGGSSSIGVTKNGGWPEVVDVMVNTKRDEGD